MDKQPVIHNGILYREKNKLLSHEKDMEEILMHITEWKKTM